MTNISTAIFKWIKPHASVSINVATCALIVTALNKFAKKRKSSFLGGRFISRHRRQFIRFRYYFAPSLRFVRKKILLFIWSLREMFTLQIINQQIGVCTHNVFVVDQVGRNSCSYNIVHSVCVKSTKLRVIEDLLFLYTLADSQNTEILTSKCSCRPKFISRHTLRRTIGQEIILSTFES